MKKQETFTDIEYSFRKRKTKREEFLEIMDEIIVGAVCPFSGNRAEKQSNNGYFVLKLP